MRPTNCVYPNCGRCTYTDCVYDGVESQERMQQDIFDKDIEAVHPSVLARRRRQKKYYESEKGKANEKRKRERKIASGKNAEYCRRYYQRKKMEEVML